MTTPTITITVVDTATIISGTTTHYRYDLPKNGIHEGWALAEIRAQLAAITQHHYPHISVRITADDATTSILSADLRAHHITISPQHPDTGTQIAAATDPGDTPEPLPQPTPGEQHNTHTPAGEDHATGAPTTGIDSAATYTEDEHAEDTHTPDTHPEPTSSAIPSPHHDPLAPDAGEPGPEDPGLGDPGQAESETVAPNPATVGGAEAGADAGTAPTPGEDWLFNDWGTPPDPHPTPEPTPTPKPTPTEAPAPTAVLAPATGPRDDDPIAQLRAQRRGRGKHQLRRASTAARTSRTTLVYGATVLVLFAGVTALTLHARATTTDTHAHPTPAPTTSRATSAATTPATPAPARNHYSILEGPGFHLQAPHGFTLNAHDDGSYTATHPDATLRLIVAIDHPEQPTTPEDYLNDIRTTIDSDDSLAYAPDQHALAIPDAPTTVEYIEYPPDGSHVHWATWARGDTTFSFGCHTKTTPTPTAREDCKKAARSLKIN